MNYTNYSTEDFIKDEKFINWIKTGDPKLNAFWKEWILSHPEEKQAFNDARIILQNLDFKKDELTEADKLDLWTKIEQQNKGISRQANIMAANHHIETDNSSTKFSDKIDINKSSISFQWRKIAATLIILFTFVGAAYYLINTNQPLPEKVAIIEIIKKNPKGQKLTTYLPDGSKVILNSLSSIRYNAPFIGKERVINLEGEAFFEVKKDTIMPFKVISKGITTTALGTSFNVNSKNDDYVEVALISGKVRVSNAASKYVILNPGKSVIVIQNGELKVQEFHYVDKAGWKDGILVFDNSSFSEIVKKLEDWYGVELKVVVKSMNQIHYTSKYKNQTLENVLQGISFVYHFEHKIVGETVEIYFKN